MKEQELYALALERNLAPYARVYDAAVCRGKQTPHAVRKGVLIAVACVCAAVLTVACIPVARAAVLRWLRPATDPAAYLTTPEDERPTDNPALAAAVEAPTAETAAIVDAVDAGWQAWAKGVAVTWQELLYDGETLHITGTLAGQTDSFLLPLDQYTVIQDDQGTTMELPDAAVTVSARYRINGGAWEYTLRDALAEHCHPSSPDADAAIARGTLPLLLDIPVGRGLTDTQTLTLELLFADMGTLRQNPVQTDADAFPACVALRFEGLTFDATAGTDMQQALPLPAAVALSGDVLVFSGEEDAADGRAQVGNDRLSLAGGTLEVLQMQQQLTGTKMAFLLTLPASWTARQCSMAADQAEVSFVIDGEDQGGFGRAYTRIRYYDADTIDNLGLDAAPDMTDPHRIAFSVETLLLPDDWAQMESLHAVLCLYEMTSYQHTALPTDGRVTVPVDPEGWSEDGALKRFTDCPLVIR